jgi:hypothetical protein
MGGMGGMGGSGGIGAMASMSPLVMTLWMVTEFPPPSVNSPWSRTEQRRFRSMWPVATSHQLPSTKVTLVFTAERTRLLEYTSTPLMVATRLMSMWQTPYLSKDGYSQNEHSIVYYKTKIINKQ